MTTKAKALVMTTTAAATDFSAVQSGLSTIATSAARNQALLVANGKAAAALLVKLPDLASRAAVITAVVVGWQSGHFSAVPAENRTRKQTACRLLANAYKASEKDAFKGQNVTVSQETGEITVKASKVPDMVEKLGGLLEDLGFTAERIRGLKVEATASLANIAVKAEADKKEAAENNKRFEEVVTATCDKLNIPASDIGRRQEIANSLRAFA